MAFGPKVYADDLHGPFERGLEQEFGASASQCYALEQLSGGASMHGNLRHVSGRVQGISKPHGRLGHVSNNLNSLNAL